MSTKIIIGIIVAILVIAALLWVFITKYLKHINESAADQSINPDMKQATDMLPFVQVFDNNGIGITDLGDDEYRLYLKVDSINYALQSDSEQDQTEVAYQRCMNVIKYPWWWFIQTHNVDDKLRQDLLTKDVRNTINKYRNTPAYEAIQHYYKVTQVSMEHDRHLRMIKGVNSKEKRKYIIIPYNGTQNYTDESISASEKRDESIKRLLEMAGQFHDQLSNVGVKCKPMSRQEIIELYTSTYNRDANDFAKNISDGVYTSYYSDNELNAYLDGLNDAERAKMILFEASNRLQLGIARVNNVDPKVKQFSNEIIEYLDKKSKESDAL